MAESLQIKSRSGAMINVALAQPTSEARGGGVVLLQEWWGVNAHIRSLVDRLALAGFVVAAPDLYKGKVATDPTTASQLMQALSWPEAAQDIGGTMDFLKQHARCNGKVGITGFCMGGAGSFFSAANIPGFSAVVPFYGIAPAQYVDWTTANPPPIQAHFASRDQWAKAEAAAAIRDTLTARSLTMELHTYDADHAFMNDTRPEVYSAENANLAWGRMIAFFQRYLMG